MNEYLDRRLIELRQQLSNTPDQVAMNRVELAEYDNLLCQFQRTRAVVVSLEKQRDDLRARVAVLEGALKSTCERLQYHTGYAPDTFTLEYFEREAERIAALSAPTDE